MRRCGLAAIGLLWCASFGLAAEQNERQLEFFEKKIRPVLVESCYQCHSAEAKIKGGLVVDTREGMRKGGDSGPAIVPGNLDASLLLEAIRYETFEMPPSGKLSAAIVADFEEWVRLGAPDPREPPKDTINSLPPAKFDIQQGKQHWAFQPPQAHPLPPVKQHAWPLRSIDAFILSKLEAAGHQPAAAADRRVLVRRLTYDLTGLPPTQDEVEDFVNDSAPQAEERLVERLLASSAYGERWARLWLDVARFAEDQAHIVGNNTSLCYPNAYLYRDWVIQALNSDMPYDEFIRRQLATDIMEPENEKGLAALGFMGLGPKYYNRGRLDVMADEWEDRVDTLSRALLGLTVACARCHDHKYDPIAARDYYALAGVFASTDMFNRPLDDKVEANKDGQSKKSEDALHIVREGTSTDLNVFIRGDVKNKGPVVPRRFIEVLCADEPTPFTKGSGRLELAQAITNRNNPLTARVMVNRVWDQLFGRGLVGTTSNFGTQGDKPTHPELLDDLAVRFMDNGWSLKWLMREITLSATYRQASQGTAALTAADPENKLLGRQNRRRLSVEQWRDGLLASSGRLDKTLGGTSIDPANPEGQRRTLYSKISRLELNKMLQLFDYPDPNAHAARRVQTTTPLQKMFVMNNPFVVAQAAAFAARILQESPSADSVAEAETDRIGLAYQLLYCRAPLPREVELGAAYMGSLQGTAQERWQQYAQVLLASNEMLFID